MQKKILPNFFIIGTAKSGSTSLYHYLRQHPDIFLSPIKEPMFFMLEGKTYDFKGPGDQKVIARLAITQREKYYEQFQGVQNEKAVGEASIWYLYHRDAPLNIHRLIPNAKHIILLRNPVERAYSSFIHVVRDRREPFATDFDRALAEEDKRIHDNWEYIWHFTKAGFYSEQIKRYLVRFGRDQVRIYLYDTDYQANTQGMLVDIFSFLGVAESFKVDFSMRYNEAFMPKNKLLYYLQARPNIIKSIAKRILPRALSKPLSKDLKDRNRYRPVFRPETRNRLTDLFRDDILKTQDLIQRDLSHWLT